MKTLLVPVGGSETDRIVFETALAVGRPLGAHLDFVHVQVGIAEAAFRSPHVAFAQGSGLRNALDGLKERTDSRFAGALRHVQELCERADIPMVDEPTGSDGMTARWFHEEGDPIERLMFHARHHDLLVLGRATRPDGLPADRLERLVMGCGRPLLIAAAGAPMSKLGTVMVCWRETADAARAMTAAMPLLAKAERVLLVSVREKAGPLNESLDELASQLAWHGIAAEKRIVQADARPIAEQLAATASELGADLMVMGAYGHSRTRELLFGGPTQDVMSSCTVPVFMVH